MQPSAGREKYPSSSITSRVGPVKLLRIMAGDRSGVSLGELFGDGDRRVHEPAG